MNFKILVGLFVSKVLLVVNLVELLHFLLDYTAGHSKKLVQLGGIVVVHHFPLIELQAMDQNDGSDHLLDLVQHLPNFQFLVDFNYEFADVLDFHCPPVTQILANQVIVKEVEKLLVALIKFKLDNK